MTLPRTTTALALRDGGFAKTPVPQVPETLSPHLELREVPLPDLTDGQVLIEVTLAPVNPSDLFFVQGGYGQPRTAGLAAGFEGVGRVVAGKGKTAEALVGQRVSFLGTRTGTWAAHAISDAALCIPLRKDLQDTDGAALIVNPLTAVALLETARDSGAKSFIVNAAGSQLGRLILGLARDEGLQPIALIRRPGDREALHGLGAAEVLVSGEGDFAEAAQKALKDHKPRVLLDAVGDQITADLFFAMPRGAVWVSYGKMGSEAPQLTQMGQFIFMDKRIEGFWLSTWLPAKSAARRAELIARVQNRFASGAWSTRIAATLPLPDAIEGILPAYRKSAGKVLLAP
ncbi:zinc-binding dehydrogenase [Pararhodobacter sp. SW119]|uniref:alcohol dehydrogenase catalytic domain-containing protein n=1 Tax=Pararhodobacter sp. SW119 TaxID=2780075 RepID=UPI001AE06DE2|nr:zinc-binding dehydrogenase [Pararhodobacter sp. SW119]